MRVAVFGAGAVGGHLAGRLAEGGAEVSIVARGAQLDAIFEHGLIVRTPEGELRSRPIASDDPAELGRQDVVLVTVKGPALPQAAVGISPLLTADTPVVFVMNGIPWWYFHAHGGELDGRRLDRIDPDGRIWNLVGPERAVGAVAHTACTVIEPGIIRVANPRNRLVMGRPDGRDDPILDELTSRLRAGGLDTETTSRIRDAVWEKVLMNLVGGSLGVLTASPMGEALANRAILDTALRMTAEAVAAARALGCDPGDAAGGLQRLRTSKHRQSILQDLEQGRPMEVDALLVAPLELAAMAGVATPSSDFVVAAAAARARSAGLYSGAARTITGAALPKV